MFRREPAIYQGLNHFETLMNIALVAVTLSAWGFFLTSLFDQPLRRRPLYFVLFLHLFPLPIAFVGSAREFQQFFAYGLLGGVALIIGVPQHGWPKGQRAVPRLITAGCVCVAFAVMYFVVPHQ